MNQPTARRAPRPYPSSAPDIDVFELQRRIRRSDLSYAEQALLMAVLDHDRYGRSHRGCDASLERLAEDIGASPRYVARMLLVLIRKKWLKADPQVGRVRPLRIGETCTKDHGTISARPPCTYEQSVPAPMNDRGLHLGTIGAVECIREREKEETVAAVRPPDGRPSAPEEEEPAVPLPRLKAERDAEAWAAFKARFSRPELDEALRREGRLRRPQKNHLPEPPGVTASQQAS